MLDWTKLKKHLKKSVTEENTESVKSINNLI